MSTPVVAGNGAMARQYFRDGWYNTGSQNLTSGFEPSAALLKAVLINSATAMSFAGVNPEASSLDVTLTDPPDDHQVRRGKGGGRRGGGKADGQNGCRFVKYRTWYQYQPVDDDQRLVGWVCLPAVFVFPCLV